jgi:hypothetical protein
LVPTALIVISMRDSLREVRTSQSRSAAVWIGATR